MPEEVRSRNLVTIKEAAAHAGVSPGTMRKFVLRRLVYATRLATGKYLVDLADVDALRIEYHPVDPNDVADAPPLSETQVQQLRSLLHSAPETSTG